MFGVNRKHHHTAGGGLSHNQAFAVGVTDLVDMVPVKVIDLCFGEAVRQLDSDDLAREHSLAVGLADSHNRVLSQIGC